MDPVHDWVKVSVDPVFDYHFVGFTLVQYPEKIIRLDFKLVKLSLERANQLDLVLSLLVLAALFVELCHHILKV